MRATFARGQLSLARPPGLPFGWRRCAAKARKGLGRHHALARGDGSPDPAAVVVGHGDDLGMHTLGQVHTGLQRADHRAVTVRDLAVARTVAGYLDPVAFGQPQPAGGDGIEPGRVRVHDLLQPLRLHGAVGVVHVPFEADHNQLIRVERSLMVGDRIIDRQGFDRLAHGLTFSLMNALSTSKLA